MICIRNAFMRLAFGVIFNDILDLDSVWAPVDDDLVENLREPRCRLQRKEPGWVVGAQRHVRVDEFLLVAMDVHLVVGVNDVEDEDE